MAAPSLLALIDDIATLLDGVVGIFLGAVVLLFVSLYQRLIDLIRNSA